MLENYEYPSGYKLKYLYDERGNQHEVRTADAYNTLLCKANAENQRGQLTKATMGNGTVTDFEWDAYGFPQRNKVSKGTNSILQNLTFSFNSVTGNLNARLDAKWNIQETFDYDNLLKDRLTYWSATNGTAKTMAYEANGNILKKTDVSTSTSGYVYDSSKPNFVKEFLSPTSAFIEQNQLQSITYTPFNKIESISQPYLGSNLKLDFTYGPDNQRRKTFLYKTSTPITQYETRYYFDDFEVKELNHKALTKKTHYLYGPDGLFGIYLLDGGYQDYYYIHKDYLGSLTAITDAAGNLVESLSYDPWGRRRNPNNWNDYNVTSTLFDRGFTGHSLSREERNGKHMPQFGLINPAALHCIALTGSATANFSLHSVCENQASADMNGRVYDPFLARFLSPDPFVQAPDYSQNYNRYSYAFNNPLKYTDPDGEWVHLVIGAVIGGVVNWAANGAEFSAKGLGHFGVGALAGALGAGVGAGFGTLAAGSGSFGFMVSQGLTASGFGAGAAAGAGAGFSSGLVTGAGNSLLNGEDFSSALSEGLRSAAIGGITGGLTGGISGGIRATRFGNDFWSGGYKKIITDQVLADAGIPGVQQNGLNDCLPACLEATDESLGGNINQHDIRSWYGGDGPLVDISTVKRYSSETNRAFEALNMTQRREYINSLSAKINAGQKVILNLRQTGNTGHAVAVNRVIERSIQYAPGLKSSSRLYQIMDPWTGSYRTVASGDMMANFIKAWNVFIIY